MPYDWIESLALRRRRGADFSLLYVVCALAVVAFPDGTLDFFNNWFHGLDLRLLRPPGGKPLTLEQFVYGLVGAAVVSFAGGAVLAGSYNVFSKRRPQ